MSKVVTLLLIPMLSLVLFVENWVTMNLFVLRKTIFLTKRVRDQDFVVTTEEFVHIVIRLGTLLMFVTRNTGILPGINLNMKIHSNQQYHYSKGQLW